MKVDFSSLEVVQGFVLNNFHLWEKTLQKLVGSQISFCRAIEPFSFLE